jgi:hypothetical protein
VFVVLGAGHIGHPSSFALSVRDVLVIPCEGRAGGGEGGGGQGSQPIGGGELYPWGSCCSGSVARAPASSGGSPRRQHRYRAVGAAPRARGRLRAFAPAQLASMSSCVSTGTFF